MTTEQTYEPMTEAEVHAFAAKTEAWWEQLTPKEQALIHQAIRSAGPGGDDVQGYGDLEYAALELLLRGNPYPALQLAVNTYWAMQSTPVSTAPGGSGGTLGTRTMLN